MCLQAALQLLLAKETRLLHTLDRLRVAAHHERRVVGRQQQLGGLAQPKTWALSNGKKVKKGNKLSHMQGAWQIQPFVPAIVPHPQHSVNLPSAQVTAAGGLLTALSSTVQHSPACASPVSLGGRTCVRAVAQRKQAGLSDSLGRCREKLCQPCRVAFAASYRKAWGMASVLVTILNMMFGCTALDPAITALLLWRPLLTGAGAHTADCACRRAPAAVPRSHTAQLEPGRAPGCAAACQVGGQGVRLQHHTGAGGAH